MQPSRNSAFGVLGKNVVIKANKYSLIDVVVTDWWMATLLNTENWSKASSQEGILHK